MRNLTFARARLAGGCAAAGVFREHKAFRTEDVLELKTVPPDALDVVARAGAADGWSLAATQKSQKSVSFQRGSSAWNMMLTGKIARASIDCVLPGRELQISYMAVGNLGEADREHVEEELAAFKKRIEKALEQEGKTSGGT